MSAGFTSTRTRERGPLEWAAVLMLLFGGFSVPFVGWVIGVLLLWASPAWKVRDKVVGTLLVPGGLLPAALAFVLTLGLATGTITMVGVDTDTALGWHGLITAVLFVVPVASGVFLVCRADRSAR